MIRNEILLKRMCQLVAQTFAVSVDDVFNRAKEVGIEAVIEKLEEKAHKY